MHAENRTLINYFYAVDSRSLRCLGEMRKVCICEPSLFAFDYPLEMPPIICMCGLLPDRLTAVGAIRNHACSIKSIDCVNGKKESMFLDNLDTVCFQALFL